MRKGVVATEPVLTLPSTVTDDSSSKSPIRLANETLILAATERVFAGAGFGGATMAAIAEAAGLPKANLHYYFGCKQELYQAVLARTLRDWLEPTHVITPKAWPSRGSMSSPQVATWHKWRRWSSRLKRAADVLNLLDYAKKTFVGGEHIHAIYGGLHIAPFEDWDAERDRIVAQLCSYAIERLACNHCTGMTAVQKMLEAGLPVQRGTARNGSKTDLFLGNGDVLEVTAGI